ncbi:MAG: FAD-binding oxidoreductase [Dehalococcoidia bacterium]|jgi:ferredoxin--NADP+ reductase|nr:FAD-binding oxidoreductase [Dehalococcoidia bacterium]
MTLNVVKGKFMWAKLTKKEQLTEDLWKMWLKPEEKFDFKPGQYCTIGSGGIERAYSIASSPDEDQIELFIELVPPPDGNLTPLLNELNVGDTVTMRLRAKGIFVLKPEFKNHVMVGTVTGVAPYVSMMRKHLKESESSNKNFIILEGASYLDEFGYDEELMSLDKSNNNVTFEASVSRPDEERNDSWTGYKGRVNNIILDRLDEWGLNPSETIVYACGHPGMIEDVKEKLENTDYTFLEERFWKD